jgi:hypothetical protein
MDKRSGASDILIISFSALLGLCCLCCELGVCGENYELPGAESCDLSHMTQRRERHCGSAVNHKMLWFTTPLCGVFHNWLCNYSTVLNPLSTISDFTPVNIGFAGAARTPGCGPPSPHAQKHATKKALTASARGRTLRPKACVEEVDNRVNCLIFQWMTLWTS